MDWRICFRKANWH